MRGPPSSFDPREPRPHLEGPHRPLVRSSRVIHFYDGRRKCTLRRERDNEPTLLLNPRLNERSMEGDRSRNRRSLGLIVGTALGRTRTRVQTLTRREFPWEDCESCTK